MDGSRGREASAWTAPARSDGDASRGRDPSGVWVQNGYCARLRGSVFEDNGGTVATPLSQSHYGVVTSCNWSPYVDMHVSPVSGNNTLCGNRDPSGYVQIDQDAGTITNFGNTITNGACP
jgi:hypothetical protein